MGLDFRVTLTFLGAVLYGVARRMLQYGGLKNQKKAPKNKTFRAGFPSGSRLEGGCGLKKKSEQGCLKGLIRVASSHRGGAAELE